MLFTLRVHCKMIHVSFRLIRFVSKVMQTTWLDQDEFESLSAFLQFFLLFFKQKRSHFIHVSNYQFYYKSHKKSTVSL